MISWEYKINKKEYIENPLRCQHLSFQLDVSNAYFRPERLSYSGMTLQTFINHARFLAQYYHAKHVIITDTVKRCDVIFFKRKKWMPNTERKPNEPLDEFYDILFHKNYIEENKHIYEPIVEPQLTRK